MEALRAIDLCCGAGGWSCAAEGMPIKIELAVDLWDVCRRTHILNHPGTEFLLADLREPGVCDSIAAAVGGHVDVVLGAIPCEWLTSGRSAAMHNAVGPEELAAERRTLAALLGLVSRLGPRWWCIEDVVQLERELPAGTPCWKCNSALFSAQARRRLYVGRFPPPLFPVASTALASDVLRPGDSGGDRPRCRRT